MELRIEEWDALRVASVRHVGPYDQCGAAWEALMSWAGPKGLMGPQTKVIGQSYDNPHETPAEELRYDACVTVGPDVEGEGDVVIQEIPAGTYAVATHKGPYSGLMGVYMGLYGEAIPAAGYRAKEQPPLEIYLNCPDTTPEDELLTELCVPVEKA